MRDRKSIIRAIVRRSRHWWRCLANTIYSLRFARKDVLLVNASMDLHKDRVVHRNFGDDLNYYILKELTGKRIFNYSQIWNVRRFPKYMCIGSILNLYFMSQKNNIVWGSGARDAGLPMNGLPKKICAVRGKLTRAFLQKQGIDCPEVYGDPALLLPFLYRPVRKKKHKLGLILHFRDQGNELIRRMVEKAGVKAEVIDIVNYDRWEGVIDRITECECIASSSLHGLIIADAYKIPNVWIRFGDDTFEGEFKYLDYFSGVGRKTKEPLRITNSTTIEKVLEQCVHYTPIDYDSSPLIQSCPFEITYPFS